MVSKHVARWAGLVLLTGALLSVIGCGRAREATEAARVAADARDGKFSVTNDKGEKTTVDTTQGAPGSQKVTATTKDGTTTGETGKSAVSEKDVGVAFYPGAKVETGTKVTTTAKDKSEGAMVTLTSGDGFDKVAKFYKDKYGKGNTLMEQPGHLMIAIKEGKEKGKVVQVQQSGDSTTILITSSHQH